MTLLPKCTCPRNSFDVAEDCPLHGFRKGDNDADPFDGPTDVIPMPELPLPGPPPLPKPGMTDPLSDKEIQELLSATLHGPLPHRTMMRVFATIALVPGLRANQRLPPDICPDCHEDRNELQAGDENGGTECPPCQMFAAQLTAMRNRK